MKISIDWIKEYIDIDKSAEELDALLTLHGLEVEGVDEFENIPGGLKGLVIGEVLTCTKHPDAEKLSLTTVDIGAEEPVQIVCGAPNVAAGQKVVVATVGAVLYPEGHEPFKIKKSKIRGQVSLGMICAEDEIGLGNSHDGIMVLDTALSNGTPAAEHFEVQNDSILEIGLTPNRVDAASHYGVARELKALTNKKLEFPDISGFTATSESPVKVSIKNTEACPRYAGLVIEGIKVAESPKWLQLRLKSIGLSPINNVVDATNYILHGLGQPLHAFDLGKVVGKEINVATCAEGTKFTTLDGEERTLKSTDLMICDQEKPMCIAGVFGGDFSGVSDGTTAIFLESAYFHPDWVRKSAQTHGLKTDASFRFERGTDPEMVIPALKAAAILITEIAGGKVTSKVYDDYPEVIPEFEVSIKYKNVDRLIGKKLSSEEIINILEGLDITIVASSEEGLSLKVPAYRVDVQREADIIEEILRIYGYDKILLSDHLSTDFIASSPKINPDKLKRSISTMLTGAGAFELMTNSLTTGAYAEASQELDSAKNITMLNALSADLDVMRQSMVFSGLEVIAHNINRKQSDLKLFEFGKTYHKEEGKYTENNYLALYVCGNQHKESWMFPTQPSNFHTLASLTQRVLETARVTEWENAVIDSPDWVYGLEYKVNQQIIAKVGQVHPSLAKKAGVKEVVFYAEINWDVLLKKFGKTVSYKAIPKYPEVRRDLSLVMNKSVSFDEIQQLAKRTERGLLKKINVFDVYEGKPLEDNQKSYSVSFILQDEKKTLNDKVIDKSMAKLMKAFESQLNIIIRK